MKIVIFGDNENSLKLFDLSKESLEGIGLSDFITVEKNNSEEYKTKLGIKKDYAFCVEEDSIEFKDVIFEGTIPPKEEMDSLLISLIGGESSSSCSPNSCLSCGLGC